MSLNSTIDQSHLAEVEVLAGMLQSFLLRKNLSPTREDKALVEAEAIALFERLLDFDYELQKVVKGFNPDEQNFREDYDAARFMAQVAISKLRKLTQLFIDHFNAQQMALTELLGKLKRVRQKRASLALWSGEEAKFVLSDKFLNLDNLGSRFTTADPCQVDTAQGVLTLPVRNQSAVAIESISVGSGSNGQAGNSDEAVTTNNISPDYIINGDPNNWFEYERLDSGPLSLSLVVQLPRAEIVNNLTIKPLNIGQSYSYEVEDIIFNSNSNTVHVADLAGPGGRERMIVKSAGNDNEWSLTFIPVYAKTITVKLKQSQEHSIVAATAQGGTSRRRRFAIGILELTVNQLRFAGEGGINSTQRDLPGGLYLGVPFVEVWPPRPELFDANIEVSFDGGETWIPAENVDDGIGSSILMNGDETSMLWRINVQREDDALDNATSFYQAPSGVREVEFFLRSVSKLKSPTSLALSSKPASGEVFVMQPRVGRRGTRFGRVLIGTGTGNISKFPIPFSPVDRGLDPDQMKMFVNGEQFVYNEDDVNLGSDEWSFSDDFSEVVFATAVDSNTKIEAVFERERMLFEQRADGYYHQMEMLFDPDLDNINVSYLPRKASRKTVLLPRDKKVISLGVTNLRTDTVELTSSAGKTYTAVDSRSDLSTANTYYLDSVNGTLWLSSEFDDDTVRISFDHQGSQPLDSQNVTVIFEQDKPRPWGVRIDSTAFQAIEETDTVGGSLVSRINPIDGSFGTRLAKVSAATDAMTLSYDYLVKGTVRVSDNLLDRTFVNDDPEEVDFIDGKTEFLGLVTMDNESTVETTLDTGEEVVTFALSAGALWYSSFGVLFSDTSTFATDVTPAIPNATGEYSIDENGSVSVYVGDAGTLTGGIKLYYYYQDPSFEEQNKYSIDYRNGVIYGGTDLQSGATVKYKASSHKVGYSIGKEVDRYSYDRSTNSVSVRTEGLDRINSLVKVVWTKRSDSDTSLRAFRDYFSPLFTNLAVRFN